MEFVEAATVIDTKWCVMGQKMVTQQIQTPQGVQVIQQPVNVPVFFRNDKEIIRFLNESKERGVIEFHYQAYDISEPIEYYYK